MTKHPFISAAEALEKDAELPRNKKYKAAYLLSAKSLRDQVAAEKS